MALPQLEAIADFTILADDAPTAERLRVRWPELASLLQPARPATLSFQYS